MPRNRAKRDAKNSRSAERGCSSVLTPPNRRRMVGARNPAPPLAGYAAQSRKARCKNSRSAERGCSSVLTPPNRRRMVGARNPAPPLAGYAAQSRKARCKNSRSAERGCSSVLTPPNRLRMVGARNPAPPLAGYAAQSRSDAQTALLPKTQPAAPYAAETSRYVPPLYTYPTKFMHNLCHIVM